MKGYLTTASGEVWQLPELLEWEILRTDGYGCDSARVTFLYEPKRLDVLKSGIRLRLSQQGETCFFGVVDEFVAQVGEHGRVVEVSCRGLMSLLMDSELRAAEFSAFYEQDAIRRLVTPFGVEKVVPGGLPRVTNFSWETATTAWAALRGYCRHAGEAFPRFTADGTLVLCPEKGQVWTLGDSSGYTRVAFRQKRYGVTARQYTVAAAGLVEEVENPDILDWGTTTQKVVRRMGKTLKASWRTGKQRLEDSLSGAVLLWVTLSGDYGAQPGDTVQVHMPNAGITGDFHLRSIRKSCGTDGRKTELELEGVPG